MKIRSLAVVAALAFVALGGDSRAYAGKHKQSKYLGVHPIAKAHGKGVCHIHAPHVHAYAPDVKVAYRVVGDANVFVGDPVAHGWDGPKVAYVGPHPVNVDAVYAWDVEVQPVEIDVDVFCYLKKPHFHVMAPEAGASWSVVEGANVYTAKLPTAYVEARAEWEPVNVYYEPIVYARPVISVNVDFGQNVWVEAPPPPPPVRVRGGAAVGVGVVGGVGMDVRVGLPSVRVVVPPPPPPPRVVVGGGVHIGGSVTVGGGGGIGIGGGGAVKVKGKKGKK
jgi:hypothetical protein